MLEATPVIVEVGVQEFHYRTRTWVILVLSACNLLLWAICEPGGYGVTLFVVTPLVAWSILLEILRGARGYVGIAQTELVFRSVWTGKELSVSLPSIVEFTATVESWILRCQSSGKSRPVTIRLRAGGMVGREMAEQLLAGYAGLRHHESCWFEGSIKRFWR